jgi:hypothetical protein
MEKYLIRNVNDVPEGYAYFLGDDKFRIELFAEDTQCIMLRFFRKSDGDILSEEHSYTWLARRVPTSERPSAVEFSIKQWGRYSVEGYLRLREGKCNLDNYRLERIE